MPDLTASATDSSIQYPTWSVDGLAAHIEALRRADEKFDQERDRRMTEAQRLYEVNHKEALVLARTTLAEALTEAREVMERQLTETKANLEERLGKLNELRQEVIEDRSTFLSREIFDAASAAASERIGILEQWRASLSSLDARLEGLNNLRAEVIHDRENYLRLDVFETRVGPGFERVAALEQWRAKREGDEGRIAKIEAEMAARTALVAGFLRRDVWEQADAACSTRISGLELWRAQHEGDNARFAKIEEGLTAISTTTATFLPREVFQQAFSIREVQTNTFLLEMQQFKSDYIRRVDYETASTVREARLSALEQWRAKALGFGFMASLAAGLVGAAIMRAVLG